MKLYLHNQTRDRDLDVYLNKLHIDTVTYKSLNQIGKKVLLVGGGYSLLKPLFINQTVIHFTNIDLDPPNYDSLPRLINIKGDFTENKEYMDEFDEIWALYSLPLYSPDKYSIYMFILKSILAIKNAGIVRFFPLEFDSSSKLHTKDADYDMTTMECTNNVLEVIEYIKTIGIKCTQEIVETKDKTRLEAVVTLSLDSSIANKQEINNILIKKINQYATTNKSKMGITIIHQDVQ